MSYLKIHTLIIYGHHVHRHRETRHCYLSTKTKVPNNYRKTCGSTMSGSKNSNYRGTTKSFYYKSTYCARWSCPPDYSFDSMKKNGTSCLSLSVVGFGCSTVQ